MFHVDQDFSVDVPLKGVQKLDTLQSPYWSVIGAGSGDGLQIRTDWTIEKTPIEKMP